MAASGGFDFGERGSIGGVAAEPSAEGASAESKPRDSDETAYRKEYLRIQNTLDAATGLLRVQTAGSGPTGTFRFSLTSSYFSGSGFLCPSCLDMATGTTNKSDDATHVAGHLGISATPVDFLEAYLGIHTTASSNSMDASTHLLQVLGDTNFGLKAFMPREKDQIFTAGGGVDAWLLNGVGSVGIDNANFALRGLATVDLNNRTSEADRIPARFHLNLGYTFENSGKLVDDYEKQNGGTRISRIRRFGLGINRVDSMRLGLGADFPFPIVVPFLEWTADVPVNRQGHVCDTQTRSIGDQCLGQDAKFSAVPSRLSLGARLYPWLDGLAFLAAFDIGTGATSNFIEEVTPEVPWNFFFGIAYAADTKPHVEVKEVMAPQIVHADLPKAPKYIQGTVVEKGSGTPVPDALVRFDGRSMTGMITMADGTFRTGDLDAGTYTFDVSANGYRDGQCTATIPISGQGAALPQQPGAPYGMPPGQPGVPGQQPYGYPPGAYPGAPGQPQQPGAPYSAPTPFGAAAPVPGAGGGPAAVVTCEVESLPKVGNVNGQLHDIDTGAAVGAASVKITDKLGRSLSLTSDGAGAFRFENVPPGPVTILAEAPGYLKSVISVEVKAHTDVEAELQLNKKPAKPNVVVTAKEIKLKREVHFQHDSAEILPDSMGILEETADVLSNRPDLSSIEIQGHTDDSGTPEYNQKLSASRANAVREALIRLGVDGARLSSRGYGQERPLVPNTNEANRAKNRRVQLMIEK
ncbi:MAG TPA: carboxypeptidase regulatory-like domain-containing protein [Polyangiaceae bacterium]|nr:carboxypeptidase regulatory-like domain-containing protein [Polyangiaceae bacterium]